MYSPSRPSLEYTHYYLSFLHPSPLFHPPFSYTHILSLPLSLSCHVICAPFQIVGTNKVNDCLTPTTEVPFFMGFSLSLKSASANVFRVGKDWHYSPSPYHWKEHLGHGLRGKMRGERFWSWTVHVLGVLAFFQAWSLNNRRRERERINQKCLPKKRRNVRNKKEARESPTI